MIPRKLKTYKLSTIPRVKQCNMKILNIPSPVCPVYSQYNQRHLHNFSLSTSLSNLPGAERSCHLQHVLSHKDTAQYLSNKLNKMRYRKI